MGSMAARTTRIAVMLMGVLLVVGRAFAGDGVWPSAARYEDLLRMVELVSVGSPPDPAAIDEAYRAYLERSGELRRGVERAKDDFDRVAGGAGSIDDLDRSWDAVRRAERRTAAAEDELADRIVSLVPSCAASATSIALRLRIADAFTVGGQAHSPFSMLLAFRPEPEDRREFVTEFERLLPVADRYLRDGMDLAIERMKAHRTYCEEFPPPQSSDVAEQARLAAAWAEGWSERRFPSAAGRAACEERFTLQVDAAIERLINRLSPASRVALEDAWNHASGVSNFAAQLSLPWQGVTADEATVAATRARVAEFLRHDREEAKAYRKLDLEEVLAWARVYQGLEQPTAAAMKAADAKANEASERLSAARSEIGSRRLNAARTLLAELKASLKGEPTVADGSPLRRGDDVVWLDLDAASRTADRTPLVVAWRSEREATLPHRWLWPEIPSEAASVLAQRIGRPDIAARAAEAIASLSTVAASVTIRSIGATTMGLAPEEATGLREEISAARRLIAPARSACFQAIRSMATDERERATIETALVELLGGDPVACTMSRSLQPWSDLSSQLARHGNVAWALERAGLDQPTLDQGRAIVARFATELMTAMDAYDAAEVDASIDACAWPRSKEELESPRDAETAIRLAACRDAATERLDAAATARDRSCEKVRKALLAELSPEAFERIRRAERFAVAPDLPRATESFLARVQQAERSSRERNPAALEEIARLHDVVIRHAQTLDEEIASIAWRPEAFHLWWPNVEVGASNSGPDGDRSRRERRRWLLFVRDETRIQSLTAMVRIGNNGEAER